MGAIALVVVIVIGFITWLFFLESVTPGPGEEAVLIHKPRIFGDSGVDDHTVKTGREYIWSSTDYVIVNTQPVQAEEHFDDLMSLDGVPLDFDAVVRYQVIDPVNLIRTFGPKWYESNVASEFRNRVRQAVRKHGMNETAIDTKAVEEIDNEVTGAMESYIAESGLPIRLIAITVGKANPPDSIKNQRIETATQQQRVLTEEQRKIAEDSRRAAELSRAAADNAYREAMQLSPEQFLRLESIKMMDKAAGGPNTTFIIGNDVSPVVGARK